MTVVNKKNYTVENGEPMQQGATFTRVIQIIRNDCPFDLTGWNSRGQIRSEFGGSLVENFNTATSGSAPTSGSLIIQLQATQSAAITAGRYLYDLEIYSASVVHRIQEGFLDVTPEITTS